VRQIPLDLGPAPLATFDSFVAGRGAGNIAALAHLRGLTGQAGAPLYLWGPAGSGKTHLLRALAGAFQAAGRPVGWFAAAAPAPWHFDPAWALVVLDDCDALDAARQSAAFSLLVEAMAVGAQVAAAGSLPPVDLPLRDDLRTRLAWGHVFAIEPLGEDGVRAALRREAVRRGIDLSDEVLDYLLTRFSRDLKHLMALLDRLDEFALSAHRPVTVPLLRRMFEQEGERL
jgi:DnaA-homolog protein